MPRAYIAEASRFRAAVLKDYCARHDIDALCMQDSERLFDEALASNPDVIFLQESVLRQHAGLIDRLRTQPAAKDACIVLLSSRPDAAPPGIDLVIASSAELSQLDQVIQRMQSKIPRALIVSSFVRSASPLVQALTASGFQVLLAATGAKGLKQSAQQAPRLVLVDGKLIDMSAPDFCRRLREDDRTGASSVFVLLPKPNEEFEQACREASAKGVLLPPFHDPQKLEMLCAATGSAAVSQTASDRDPCATPLPFRPVAELLILIVSAGGEFAGLPAACPGVTVTTVQTLQSAKAALRDAKPPFALAIADYALSDAPNGEILDSLEECRLPTVVLLSSFAEVFRDKLLGRRCVVDYHIRSAHGAEQVKAFVGWLKRHWRKPVLLVGQFSGCKEVLTSSLGALQFQLCAAADADEATALIKTGRPAWIVVDDTLRSTTGIEFVARIRATGHSDVKILGLAPRQPQHVAVGFLKAGASDVLIMPAAREEFWHAFIRLTL